ncbi:hypothetical protein [Absiella sp. AM29-15]|uniref:hypothetical protein n=1 Tax=Absiella sp. AM29-15 TaxID=2292278 RepID=UPI0018F163BE|nr:hypothetical protein [Absiella sp. AM29-15]
MKKETLKLCNVFLLGIITGFLLTPIRRGVNVHVENNGLPYTKCKKNQQQNSHQ